MADTLRRQTDDFIDVVDLRDLIAALRVNMQKTATSPMPSMKVVRLKSLMTAASSRNNEPRSALSLSILRALPRLAEFLDEARDKNLTGTMPGQWLRARRCDPAVGLAPGMRGANRTGVLYWRFCR